MHPSGKFCGINGIGVGQKDPRWKWVLGPLWSKAPQVPTSRKAMEKVDDNCIHIWKGRRVGLYSRVLKVEMWYDLGWTRRRKNNFRELENCSIIVGLWHLFKWGQVELAWKPYDKSWSWEKIAGKRQGEAYKVSSRGRFLPFLFQMRWANKRGCNHCFI